VIVLEVWTKAMEMLRDGKWHSLYEIQNELELTKFKTLLLVNFLKSYGFCDVKSGSATSPPCPITAVRLRDNVIKFLEDLDKLET
jgi:hypothetical protein